MYYKIYFIKNCDNDISYLALKSTRTTYTITSLNISKNFKNKILKMNTIYSGNYHKI